MASLASLTLYGARSNVSGFDDLIRADAGEALAVRNFSGKDVEGNDWDARLYMWSGTPQPPAWLGFVRDGFGNDITVPDRTSTPAVIAVRVKFFIDRYFALTLGGGHFKLEKASIQRGYGLRVALNAIYEEDDNTGATLGYVARIRQVETRTVGAQTIRALQQANRQADFDAFGTDAELDQLAGVTGAPADGGFARRVSGKDSIRLGRNTLFAELGKACRDVARRSTKKTYQRRFEHIDRVAQIGDATLIGNLRDLAAEDLTDGGDFEIAPPELVNFDAVDQFELILPDGTTDVFVDPTAAAIRDRIVAEYGPVTADLIGQCRIHGIDAAGDTHAMWPLWECLDAQLTDNGDTYLLRDGEFYLVDPAYLNTLNSSLAVINESAVVLPNSHRITQADGTAKEIDEGTYNQKAADSNALYLNLDKKTVRAEGHTSPIEICDVLSSNGHLIHVKRKFSSASLSHLFSQGLVSGRLLLSSGEFRQAVRTEIGPAEAFHKLFTDPLVAGNLEVVYGIVAEWGNRTLIDLPFFSKVNLARNAGELRTLGYSVTYKPIGID